jgi:apolipoprotein N-acyltransferase
LRAVESGRWVVQVSPTGFSAFVGPDGTVYDRTAVSEQAVITHTVALRSGRTWYAALGNLPFLLAALGVLALSLAAARRFRVPASP